MPPKNYARKHTLNTMQSYAQAFLPAYLGSAATGALILFAASNFAYLSF